MCVCRFHTRTRKEGQSPEKVESNYSNHAHTRKKMEIQGQSNKLSAGKGSVLQSIYGEIIAFCSVDTRCDNRLNVPFIYSRYDIYLLSRVVTDP